MQGRERILSEQSDASQSEFIRNELRKLAQAGHDLTIKDSKVKAVKEIAKTVGDKWQLSERSAYAAVTRQVPTVLADIARGSNPSVPHRPVQSSGGGAEVKISMPKEVPKQPEAPKAPAAPQAKFAVPQAGQRVLEDMSILQSPEYQYVYLQYYTAFLQIRGGIAGIVGSKLVAKKKEYQELAQQWAISHIRYQWDFPDWLNKALLFAGTASVIAMPILTKSNILEMVLGSGEQKAADGSTPQPERSSEPLT